MVARDGWSPARLDGIAVALVTPWLERGGVDVAALERLAARVADAGVAAVCPAGTTGEGPRLSRDARVDVVRRCADAVGARVGIVGGVTSASVEETLAELEAQAAAGAHAALVTPPTRLPLGTDGVRAFFAALAERTPLPIVLYHIPALTGVPVPPEVVVELAAHPAIVGLKDSAGDVQYHLRVADLLLDAGRRDFALVTGTDAMLVTSLNAGGSGAILASANLVPELSVGLHRAVRAGDPMPSPDVQRRLRAIVVACRRGSLPAGWKAALALAGRCGGDVVPPGEPLDAAQVAALRADLERLEVLA